MMNNIKFLVFGFTGYLVAIVSPAIAATAQAQPQNSPMGWAWIGFTVLVGLSTILGWAMFLRDETNGK
jgi:drug/metabolite transporter (DMT)-like permease